MNAFEPEMIVLKHGPDFEVVFEQIVGILVERGIAFAWSGDDELPENLPGDMASVRAVLYDAADPRYASGPVAERLAAFEKQGGYVIRVTDPADVNEYRIRQYVELPITNCNLKEQAPQMLACLAARSDEQILRSIMKRYTPGHRSISPGWTDVEGWMWRALELLHELTGDPKYSVMHADLVDSAMANAANKVENLDNIIGLQSVLLRYELTRERKNLDYARVRLDRVLSDEYGKIEGVALLLPGRDRYLWPEALAMCCPAMAKMTQVTGERRYADYAKHAVRKVAQWCVDPQDGIWMHGGRPGQRVGAKWGRGNGWGLLGLKETLRRLDPADPFIREGAAILARNAEGYRRYQDDRTGIWRNVIDHPAARFELTGSAIITGAMAACVRHGWVEAEWLPDMVERGWRGVKSKIWRGQGCTQVIGTHLADNLQFYLARFQRPGPATHILNAYAEVMLMRKAREEPRKREQGEQRGQTREMAKPFTTK